MAKRAPTAYFLFAAEQRSAVHQEISEANGGKASVALVGKAIGEKWQQLTDEERQHYKDLAAQKAAEFKGNLVKNKIGRDALYLLDDPLHRKRLTLFFYPVQNTLLQLTMQRERI